MKTLLRPYDARAKWDDTKIVGHYLFILTKQLETNF